MFVGWLVPRMTRIYCRSLLLVNNSHPYTHKRIIIMHFTKIKLRPAFCNSGKHLCNPPIRLDSVMVALKPFLRLRELDWKCTIILLDADTIVSLNTSPQNLYTQKTTSHRSNTARTTICDNRTHLIYRSLKKLPPQLI